MVDLDIAELREATAGPGQDPRVWVSYGIVNREQEDQHSVEFDPDLGPIVWVVLQPHNQLVACRVAGGVAGNGEGEWHPFLEADEVIVLIPEGDTRTTPVIVGRLNNSFDKFPDKVAGKDTSLNNLGFLRRRGPYIIEGDSSMLLRSAVTGAMVGIDENGNVTMRNGEGFVLQLGANGVALQNKDGDMQIALDVEKRVATMGVGGSAIRLAESGASQIGVGDTLELSAAGVSPTEHLVTLEQLVNILASLLTNAGSGAPLGFFVGPPGTGFANRPAAEVAISAALSAIAMMPLTAADLAGIATALQVPKPPPTPVGPGGSFVQVQPGVGCAGLIGG